MQDSLTTQHKTQKTSNSWVLSLLLLVQIFTGYAVLIVNFLLIQENKQTNKQALNVLDVSVQPRP